MFIILPASHVGCVGPCTRAVSWSDASGAQYWWPLLTCALTLLWGAANCLSSVAGPRPWASPLSRAASYCSPGKILSSTYFWQENVFEYSSNTSLLTQVRMYKVLMNIALHTPNLFHFQGFGWYQFQQFLKKFIVKYGCIYFKMHQTQFFFKL